VIAFLGDTRLVLRLSVQVRGVERFVYCTVREFTAPDGEVIIPGWVLIYIILTCFFLWNLTFLPFNSLHFSHDEYASLQLRDYKIKIFFSSFSQIDAEKLKT